VTVSDADRDTHFMAEAVALSRTHLGQTGTNPSVGTLIVNDGTIVGRGVTALGGRPHAETIALDEAGTAARGATAYVTLEPCAHHGSTPPCAQALINAGIARVVCALEDLDSRVSGKGYAMLRDAGLQVDTGIGAHAARDVLGGYLIRKKLGRVAVTLKLAVSADRMIGRSGEGQVAITGKASRDRVHRMRAEHNLIMVGIGTAMADDPMLDCRLEGWTHRSPARVIVDYGARLPVTAKLVRSAAKVPVILATCAPDSDNARRLAQKGVQILPCDDHQGAVALPELLGDLAERGAITCLLEGGATLAQSFLDADLVDRLVVFDAPVSIGMGGIAAPAGLERFTGMATLYDTESHGDDTARIWDRPR